jgi:hypothetical protein
MVSITPRPLYPPGKAHFTHWIGGWVGPRTGLDDVEKRKLLTLPGLALRPLGYPAHSQSLIPTTLSLLLDMSNVYVEISAIPLSRILLSNIYCIYTVYIKNIMMVKKKVVSRF